MKERVIGILTEREDVVRLPNSPMLGGVQGHAAWMRALNAFSFTLSPSRKSMARRRLPSRLALKSPAGHQGTHLWRRSS